MAHQDRSRATDAAQGLAALVGITVGVIPLVQMLVLGRGGALWSWLLGVPVTPTHRAAAALVTVGAVVVITVLELRRRRRGHRLR